MRVLVTGATGNVGRPTLEALRARGLAAVAAVRPGSAMLDTPDTVALDFADPDTWPGALDGIDALFLLRPPAISDVESTLHAFVDRGADRLQQVVFLSVAGAEKNRFIPHAKVEAHLRAGPVPWTFLRAGFFAQNLCGPYRADIRDHDRLYVPAGLASVSWVDTRDLGEAAAIAFERPEARGAAWLLTGGEACAFHDVADRLTAELGRPIRYVPASILGYLAHLRDQGLAWAPALVYTVLHTAVRMGAEARVDPTLGALLGRPPRTITDTIRDHRALWLP